MEVEIEYGLKQSLLLHEKDVRCVDVKHDVMVTGSLDKTVCVLKKREEEWLLEGRAEGIWDELVYSVSLDEKGEKVGVGVKNGDIYFLLVDTLEPIAHIQQAHSSIVSCIQWLDHIHLATGGWDGRCIVWQWQQTQWIQLHCFDNHKHAVTITRLQCTQQIITGSQDGALNLLDWHTGQVVQRAPGVHNDIVRGIVEAQGIGIYTVSNDEHLRLFSYSLDLLQQVQQASGFIFCLGLSGDQVVTGGDDCVLRIYKDTQMKQSINQVGTVWQLQYSGQDVVVALSDGSIRIWGTSNWLSQVERDAYSLASQQVNVQQGAQQLSTQQINSLPLETAINSMKGTKEGEVKMFKGEKGKVMAYSWCKGEWVAIGEVTGQSAGLTAGTKHYPGDKWFPSGQYDYIFNVELEAGQQTLLPFNRTDNPMVAAEMFLVREQLPKSYVPQIIEFIKTNTQPQQQNQHQQPQNNKNTQVQKINKQFKYFPLKGSVYFTTLNANGLKNKTLQFNTQMRDNKHPLALNDTELNHFDTILEFVSNLEANQKKKLNSFQYDLMQKLLTWPREFMVPIFDLLRIFCLHHQSERLFSGVDSGLTIVLRIVELLKDEKGGEQEKTLGLKVLSNMCNFTQNQNSLFRFSREVIEGVEKTSKENNSKGFRNALGAFVANYSVGYSLVAHSLYTQQSVQLFFSFLLTLLQAEQFNVHIFTLAVSLGNLVTFFHPNIPHKPTITTILNNKQLQYDQDHDKIKETFRDILSLL